MIGKIKIVLPRGEIPVVTSWENDSVSYVISTGTLDKTWYYRYNNIDGTLIKQKEKSHNPKDLE